MPGRQWQLRHDACLHGVEYINAAIAGLADAADPQQAFARLQRQPGRAALQRDMRECLQALDIEHGEFACLRQGHVQPRIVAGLDPIEAAPFQPHCGQQTGASAETDRRVQHRDAGFGIQTEQVVAGQIEQGALQQIGAEKTGDALVADRHRAGQRIGGPIQPGTRRPVVQWLPIGQPPGIDTQPQLLPGDRLPRCARLQRFQAQTQAHAFRFQSPIQIDRRRRFGRRRGQRQRAQQQPGECTACSQTPARARRCHQRQSRRNGVAGYVAAAACTRTIAHRPLVMPKPPWSRHR